MNKILLLVVAMCASLFAQARKATPTWPDGTAMDAWFQDTAFIAPSTLGRCYVVTDYGVSRDSSVLQTSTLQAVIDRCAREGGGVVVVPRGTFLSGSLFFRQGTNLWLEEGARLKGSDRVEDFAIKTTRIEGQTCPYFTALVNVDSVRNFVIGGKGTIDGNGMHYWKQFWLRRQWNRQCTNKDEQRPRLVYISHSSNVTVQGVRIVNSPFWTNHLYKCDHVRYLGCYIYAPTEGLKGPSTDALDIDVCHDILVNNCYMNVNDDAVVLKGGKGTFADKDPDNGPNYNILVQNCEYNVVSGCLTVGSESLNDRNIVLRNIHAGKAHRVLWLKMRPDTPQHYEYITVENVTGNVGRLLVARPWTQFYKLEKRDDMPLSKCNNIVFRNINTQCDNFFDVAKSDKYSLTDFTFDNVRVTDKKGGYNPALINHIVTRNLYINNIKQTNNN